VGGSIAGGMMAASYAVGGIDPFYRMHPQPSWTNDPAKEIAVAHDDFLPAMDNADPVAAADPPLMPITPPRFESDDDWAAVDAREQREYDRALRLADAALNDPVQLTDYDAPRSTRRTGAEPAAAPAPVAPAPAPAAPAVAGIPVTPNDTLIY